MKPYYLLLATAGLLLVPLAVGCGGGVNQQTIQVNAANDPLSEPRSLLKRYAEGQAIGSESMGYPVLVEKVRETDPKRADILESGLAELQAATPAKRKAIATKLLEELQPQMHGGEPAAEESSDADAE